MYTPLVHFSRRIIIQQQSIGTDSVDPAHILLAVGVLEEVVGHNFEPKGQSLIEVMSQNFRNSEINFIFDGRRCTKMKENCTFRASTFSEVIRMVEEVVLPNYRSNLSDEELQKEKHEKKPINEYKGNSIIAQENPELLEKTKASIIELTGEIRMVAFKAVNVKAVDLLLEPQKDSKTKMQSTPRETPMEILGSRPGFYYNCFVCQTFHGARDLRRNRIEWRPTWSFTNDNIRRGSRYEGDTLLKLREK